MKTNDSLCVELPITVDNWQWLLTSSQFSVAHSRRQLSLI